MKSKSLTAAALLCALSASAQDTDIVATSAYRWHGDTITQGPFFATAPGEYEIISTYSAEPGFGFPIEKQWKLKNDISAYPQLSTPNTLHTAIYNMGLDEMVNAVEPDTTLRTGKEWAGVWTRDVSYSILLSMAYLQPEASKISLMKKVNPNGVIIQDTGSGGAWPVSSDRIVWALAAYEIYKVTGDRQWLEYIYPIITKSIADDELTVASENGLTKGETSFIDWREQSHPRWMQTADIYRSETLSTSIVHTQAVRIAADIARRLGKKKDAEQYSARADKMANGINTQLWMPEKGYYAMYKYGRINPIVNPRAETLGESLAILYDIATPERADSITQNNPTTPFGTAIFYPQIADMPPYHNNSLWPWVGAYWAMANAKAANEEGTLEAIGAVFRPAALFATNKENFVLDNGDIATELNSSNMLWCLAGNLAITHKILFGIHFEPDGLAFAPFVPKNLAAERSLTGFKYRDAVLNITVKGYGSKIKTFTLNGKEHKPYVPADIKGVNDIVITMADDTPAPKTVNRRPNAKAPLTPIAWLENSPALDGPGVPTNNLLRWNPIEYIGGYIVLRDGKPVARTRQTSFNATVPGEYQVIGVAGDGTESFASEPRCNYPAVSVQMPGEVGQMSSPEISYKPAAAVEGFHGAGFRELDQTSAPVTVAFDTADGGTYAISLRYANGNGPVNTENKCAIRTLSLDTKRLGIVVMPQRGTANWNDWGESNTIIAEIAPGKHIITLDFRPENTNMNIDTNHAIVDEIILRKVK